MRKLLFAVCMLAAGFAQAATTYAFGDSITVGVSAPYSYASPASAYYKQTLVNKAVSGSQITNQATQIYGTAFTPDDVSLWLTGYNDVSYVFTGHNVSMTASDGVHPNETGQIHIGVAFINIISQWF